MKIANKFILLTLLLPFCISCNNQNETSDSDLLPSDYKMINDFECWDDLATLLFKDSFGKATINTDLNYIKHGQGSMKVEIFSTYEMPTILLYPGFNPINKSNFNDVDRIITDVYNSSDEEVSIFLNIDSRSTYGFEMDATAREYILKPNSWNKVVYDLNREYLLDTFSLDEVMHIAMRFERIKSDPYTLYIDNMQIHINDELKAKTYVRESDEIMFFENDRDIDYFNCTSYYFLTKIYPIIDINIEPKYVSQGKKSLRVRIPEGTNGAFPMIELHNNKEVIDRISKANGISLDIFNANNLNIPIDIHIRDFNRTSGGALKASVKRQVWIEANSWSTITFSKEELIKGSLDMNNILELSFEFIDQKNFIANDQYTTFYFDNFKIL